MRKKPSKDRKLLNPVAAFLQTKTTAELEEFAERCGTTLAYLKQLKGGYRERKLGHQLARKFVEHSRGELTLHLVRADIWGRDAR